MEAVVDLQVVASRRGYIVLDAQGAERGADGRVRHNHGIVRLSFEVAHELAEFVDHLAEEPPNARQPGLWSDARCTQPIRRRRHAS